jgi:serine/threonine protein kinase
MATISCPFSTEDFFVSPELLEIKEIPSKIHFKTSYFSLGLLLIYMLLADDEFYTDYLKHKYSEKILESLNNHPVKNTRIFWLLSRCLVEDPKSRSIILI